MDDSVRSGFLSRGGSGTILLLERGWIQEFQVIIIGPYWIDHSSVWSLWCRPLVCEVALAEEIPTAWRPDLRLAARRGAYCPIGLLVTSRG